MLPIVINISKEKKQTIHKENVTDSKVGAQDNEDTMRSAPAPPPHPPFIKAMLPAWD